MAWNAIFQVFGGCLAMEDLSTSVARRLMDVLERYPPV
jgi:hypothetical protein